MQFSLEELSDIAECLESRQADCRVALSQHEDKKHTASWKNVQERQQFLHGIEERIRDYLQEQTGSRYASSVKLPWQRHETTEPEPEPESVEQT